MATIKSHPAWIKDKKVAADFEVIEAEKYDDIKDFRMDTCYVLIRVYRDTADIGVAICANDHTIQKEFRGRRAQDIYGAVFKYAEEKKLQWITRVDHAAYLGKELKKAEISLALGSDYYQE